MKRKNAISSQRLEQMKQVTVEVECRKYAEDDGLHPTCLRTDEGKVLESYFEEVVVFVISRIYVIYFILIARTRTLN